MEEGGGDCNPPLFLILRGSHPCVWSQRTEKRRIEDEDDGGAPLFNVKGGPSLSPPPLFFFLPFSLQRGRGEIGRSPRMEMGREGGRRRNSGGGRRGVPFSSHFLAVFLCHRRRRCCGHRQSLSLSLRGTLLESLFCLAPFVVFGPLPALPPRLLLLLRLIHQASPRQWALSRHASSPFPACEGGIHIPPLLLRAASAK